MIGKRKHDRDNSHENNKYPRQLQYPLFTDGITRLTPINHLKNGNDIISFEEMMQPQRKDIQHILLTSMVIDWPWLLSIIPESIPMTVVCNYDHKHEKAGHHSLSGFENFHNILLVHPPFYNVFYGTMHAKLILIFHKTSLRMIISSANLVPCDYEEIQNIVYIQDFPRCSESIENNLLSDLHKILSAMRIPKNLLNELNTFDYSRFRHQLILSIPMTCNHDREVNVGLMDLNRKLKSLNKDISNPSDSFFLEYQCSSIGQLRSEFIHDFIKAATGTSTKSLNISLGSIESHLHIIFPSFNMVVNIHNGPSKFSTVFLGQKAYQHDEFPRSSLYHSKHFESESISMHSKILTLWNKTPRDSHEKPLYIYFGSHNLSTAAWGSWTKKRDKFIIKNYELGILMDCDSFSFPYRCPERYSTGELPWMQDYYETL